VVQIGETLSQIANEVYEDPSQWRAIADQNTILDPLELKRGTVLEIPTLTA
jgi:nucleoid-associated protein YgaU